MNTQPQPLQTAVNSKKSTWAVRAPETEPAPNKFRIDVAGNWLAVVKINGELLGPQQKRIVELMAAAPELRAALKEAHDQLAVMLGSGYSKVRELRVLLDKTAEVA